MTLQLQQALLIWVFGIVLENWPTICARMAGAVDEPERMIWLMSQPLERLETWGKYIAMGRLIQLVSYGLSFAPPMGGL